MAHAQQQILDALRTVLLNGGTVAGTRVFLDRVDPLQANELPAILIEEGEGGERAETLYLSGEERRELDVQVSCVLAAATTAPADSRAFGLAVEVLIAGSASLGALARLERRITESRIVINGEGDRLLSARRQSWRFAYLVSPTAPDVIL